MVVLVVIVETKTGATRAGCWVLERNRPKCAQKRANTCGFPYMHHLIAPDGSMCRLMRDAATPSASCRCWCGWWCWCWRGHFFFGPRDGGCCGVSPSNIRLVSKTFSRHTLLAFATMVPLTRCSFLGVGVFRIVIGLLRVCVCVFKCVV